MPGSVQNGSSSVLQAAVRFSRNGFLSHPEALPAYSKCALHGYPVWNHPVSMLPVSWILPDLPGFFLISSLVSALLPAMVLPFAEGQRNVPPLSSCAGRCGLFFSVLHPFLLSLPVFPGRIPHSFPSEVHGIPDILFSGVQWFSHFHLDQMYTSNTAWDRPALTFLQPAGWYFSADYWRIPVRVLPMLLPSFYLFGTFLLRNMVHRSGSCQNIP